jgi:predicted dienelactone hydrolase
VKAQHDRCRGEAIDAESERSPSMKIPTLIAALVAWITCLIAGLSAGGQEYDPLARPDHGESQTLDLTIVDKRRDREIPVRTYVPPAGGPAPVVLFSHGLGGTREGCQYLGRHWSAQGYVAVFLQHAGSDDSVWKDVPPARRLAAMEAAASPENFRFRVEDVRRVLDQLEVWNRDTQHALAGRLDLTRVGMSGHSFGAVTTQAVSGQSAPLVGQRFTDPRIRAAIAFSPSSPRRGDPAAAFGQVKIPWMLMTGTQDVALIGGAKLESRTSVYPHLPGTIAKYELVLHNAEHSAFSDRGLPGDRQQRNPRHHQAILALSTAFWDVHLKQNEAAGVWLHGAGARAVLEAQDRWQFQAGRTPEE